MLTSPGLSLVIRKLDLVIQVPYSNILEREKLIFIYSMLIFNTYARALYLGYFIYSSKQQQKIPKNECPHFAYWETKTQWDEGFSPWEVEGWNSRINRATPGDAPSLSAPTVVPTLCTQRLQEPSSSVGSNPP